MKIKASTLFLCGFLLTSCAANLKSNFQNSGNSLGADAPVAILDLKNPVPEGAIKVGNAKFGDTGFSTNCNFNSNLARALEIARKNGANIVKVTETKGPDLWSTCYRMKIDFYTYNGNLKNLQQYKLQTN